MEWPQKESHFLDWPNTSKLFATKMVLSSKSRNGRGLMELPHATHPLVVFRVNPQPGSNERKDIGYPPVPSKSPPPPTTFAWFPHSFPFKPSQNCGGGGGVGEGGYQICGGFFLKESQTRKAHFGRSQTKKPSTQQAIHRSNSN